MNLVKKIFISIFGLLAYPFSAVPALAANIPNEASLNPCEGATDISLALCKLGTNPGSTIQAVVVFLIVLAVVIALMYLLYGGIKWITSRGEKTEVESARNHIMAAIIGLVVVFVAIFVVSLVMSIFGLNLTTLKIPTINP
jgi:hypothetical protein